jgi:predicted P-loop ATPase
VKKDEIVVLESPQGLHKSSALAVLARNPAWFADNFSLNCSAKEALEQLQGKWIVELAEMRGMRKADVDALKAFIASCRDRARPAYGRHSIDQPRQCVFFGSTNSARYLRDATGNRRFWPIAIREFDLERLRRDVDQLWAEAAGVEASGESLFLDPRLYEAARFGYSWTVDGVRRLEELSQGV